MPSARKEKLSFLKMLIVPGCLEEMQYPDRFVRRAHLNIGSHLTVCTSLDSFQFGVERVNGRLICERAEWLRFVAVHNTQFGEFVFFRHRGRMVFDATVIVPSMSSKKYDVEPVTSDEFELTVPRSSGSDYHTPRQAALCIPTHFWRGYELSTKRTAVLKAVRRGDTIKEVGLRWKNNGAADGRGTFWMKDGYA
ncbi:hypothetical protein BUALT_Bualt18G0037500 [Buddleja alternifolia]|uniref:Uncharacterized protein n=1 Tax=Buddleja alternifolia TaxID=168488 RepID=A0AAV6W1S9_9LAMI|nr:hypothetical protein BUALT_Bualt18G0037500 [Buddleja alternifolia]